MTDLVKSRWHSDGDNIKLSMPIAKVDKANRLVSGFATLDNEDTQGDVVLAEASLAAFSRARGNLREMHESKAVGRIVDFREDEFYDPTADGGAGKFYRGIFVTARVSEGAPDTWTKVLDGTLSGFSIGGEIIDATNEFVKDSGKSIRFIKDYELVELSLVDNPANQLANVFSIQKVNGSVKVEGMAADTILENVFYCEKDNTIQAKESDVSNCPECDSKMVNIGWFESGNDRAEKVRAVVAKFLSGTDIDKGGVTNMNPEEKEETVEKVDEVEAPAAVEEVETPTDEVVVPEEVADEEEAIAKSLDALKDAVEKSIAKSREDTDAVVSELRAKMDEAHTDFMSKVSELDAKFVSLDESLNAAKGKLADVEKSLGKMNKSAAVKKSSDIEPEVADVQENNTWNGAFSVKDLWS